MVKGDYIHISIECASIAYHIKILAHILLVLVQFSPKYIHLCLDFLGHSAGMRTMPCGSRAIVPQNVVLRPPNPSDANLDFCVILRLKRSDRYVNEHKNHCIKLLSKGQACVFFRFYPALSIDCSKHITALNQVGRPRTDKQNNVC